MPFRRTRFRSFRRGLKPKYMWIRDDQQVISPTMPATFDLLLNWKTHMNFNINLPQLTIWRFILKLSIVGTISVAGTPKAGDGIMIAAYVDDANQASLAVNSFPYAQQYLIYDHAYSAQSETEGGGTNIALTTTTGQILYREYDIKSRRRFRALDDTLFLQLVNISDFLVSSYSYNLRVLVRLPA